MTLLRRTMNLLILSAVTASLFVSGLMTEGSFSNAQQSPTNITTVPATEVPTTETNFTQLFSQDKEFQSCNPVIGCIPTVDVVYQGPIMLLLKSSFIDTIWKAVEFAKKEGYKIDGISTYTTTDSNGQGTINTLVAMSKG